MKKSSASRGKKKVRRVARKGAGNKTRRQAVRARNTVKKRRKQSGRRVRHDFDWDVVPFAVAIVVAIIVVMQSVQSARDLRNSHGTAPDGSSLYIMEGGCAVDNATYRKIKVAERGALRALEINNKELATDKMEELRRTKTGACL